MLTLDPALRALESRGIRCAFAIAFALVMAAPVRAFEDIQPPLRLTIVGDSTVSDYPAAAQTHGWGEFLRGRLRPRVEITNAAVPGSSTGSFIADGSWNRVIAGKPSVVLIQMGHNDLFQKIPVPIYEANLRQFVNSARMAGAIPILVTPMQMMVFRNGRFAPSLGTYSDAMRRVAISDSVTIVDLNDLSGQLFTKLGPAKTAQLASAESDSTHFNRIGAQAIAEIVLHELGHLKTPLLREVIVAGETNLNAPVSPSPTNSPAKPVKATPRRIKG